MKEPIKVKAMSLQEAIIEVGEIAKQANRDHERVGGVCLDCGDNPSLMTEGKAKPGLNNFCCSKCNDGIEELLKQLRGPGFMELNIPIGGSDG